MFRRDQAAAPVPMGQFDLDSGMGRRIATGQGYTDRPPRCCSSLRVPSSPMKLPCWPTAWRNRIVCSTSIPGAKNGKAHAFQEVCPSESIAMQRPAGPESISDRGSKHWAGGRARLERPSGRRRPVQPGSGDLTLPRFWRRYAVTPVQGTRVRARFGDKAPFLLARAIGGGHVVLADTSADTSWSDWPKHPTFVPWLYGVCHYLVGDELSLGAAPQEPLVSLIPPAGKGTSGARSCSPGHCCLSRKPCLPIESSRAAGSVLHSFPLLRLLFLRKK